MRKWGSGMAMAAGGAVLVLALSGESVEAGEVVKVGVMDKQAVFERTKAGKLALEEFNSYSTTRRKILQADDQELSELRQALQEQAGKLSEAARDEKQGQFNSKFEAFQRRAQEFSREVQQKETEMGMEFDRKIAAAAQVVAQKESYVAILDKGSKAPVPVILYHQPSLDVTDLIVKEFDQQNP